MTILRRAALDAHRVAPEVMAALVAAIDINDHVDCDAPLPVPVGLDGDPRRLVEGFCLSRQLWQARFEPVALADLATRLRRGETIDQETRAWFKQVRAAFKHLRFAFFLYSADHRAPPLLSLVTLVMGELQDSIRVRGGADIRRHAARLRWLMAGPPRRLLMRETDRLVPSDAEEFRRFTLAQIASIRPMLATPATTAHAFHAARKVVSRQVSFHDDMRTLHHGDGHRAMARWLATLNGLMGQYHDDLVARAATGTFDYRRDAFVPPEAIRDRLAALVALYLGDSSSKPSST